MKNSVFNMMYDLYRYMDYQNLEFEDICTVCFSAQEHMQAIDVLNEAFKSALDLEFYLE